MPIGWPELLVVLVIVLLVFGPKRLPMLGKQLGGGMREFKDSITSKGGSSDKDDDDAPGAPEASSPAELERGRQADVLDPTPDLTRTPTGERDEPSTRRGA